MPIHPASEGIPTLTAPSHPKRAEPEYPILEVVAQRWSPYAFDASVVTRDELMRCLEAARWAASSYNEQPWSFLLALRADEAEFQKMLGVLVESNRAWARHASGLLLAVIRRTRAQSGQENRLAEHDLGLAMGNFCAEATALGLHVHQMAGVHLEAARVAYSIPDGHDPMTAVAVGRAIDPDAFARAHPEDAAFAERDRSREVRKPRRRRGRSRLA